MANPINLQQLTNASIDADTLGQVINGDDNTDVTSRMGQTYPTLDKALKLIMQNGMVGAMPFKTYQELLTSNLANDSYAVVTNDNDSTKNGVWQRINGVWTYSKYNTLPEVKAYVSAYIAQQFGNAPTTKTKAGNDIVFAFADEKDKVGVNFDSKGNINANNITSADNHNLAWAVVDDNDSTPLAITKTGGVIVAGATYEQDSRYAYAIADDNGNVAFAIDKTGNIINPSFNQLQNNLNKIKPTDSVNQLQKTELMHIFTYGQSLSRGTTSLPVISTSQPYKNLMFKSGVLPRYLDPHDFSDFVPLVEQAVANEGESPISGTVNGLTAIGIANGGTADTWQFVGNAAGMGAQPIENLRKGKYVYASLIEEVKAAYQLAQQKGKSYSVWAMCFAQGEDNYAYRTTQGDYYTMLKELYDNFCDDVQAITHQKFKPILVTYQTMAHRFYDTLDNRVAIAQLDLANNYDNVMMSCPIYHLTLSPDNLHLTNDSSYKMGRYFARAIYHAYTTKTKFEPLQPIGVVAQGKIVDIEFNKKGLVFDTATIPKQPNFGFDIYNGTQLLDIVSIDIVDSNRVKITLASDLPSGSVLYYARGRSDDNHVPAKGNLRDSAGDNDNYVDSKGNTQYLHNWCVMFKQFLN